MGVAASVLLELWTTGRALLVLAEPSTLRTPYAEWIPALSAPVAIALLTIWIGSASAFLLGWHTRASGAVLALVLSTVLAVDQQLYSNHLYLMVLVVALLVIADSGTALSMDARSGTQRDTVPLWPVWLLRVQVSLVYGYAALAKLNLPFLSGSVIASSLRRTGPLAVPDAWRTAEPMFVLAVLTVLAESFVAVALWLPKWRPLALVTGLGLHATITLWLSPGYQLLVFSVLMLSLYVLFLPVPAQKVRVVWDDDCSFCGRWVAWFRRLDWLAALEFVPLSRLGQTSLPVTDGEASLALQAVTDRRVYGGYTAVAVVASVLPVSFLVAPLMRLPPVAAVGVRLYQGIARRRSCSVPSTGSAVLSARTGEGAR